MLLLILILRGNFIVLIRESLSDVIYKLSSMKFKVSKSSEADSAKLRKFKVSHQSSNGYSIRYLILISNGNLIVLLKVCNTSTI